MKLKGVKIKLKLLFEFKVILNKGGVKIFYEKNRNNSDNNVSYCIFIIT